MARVLRMPDVASDEDDGVLAAWLVDELSTFEAAQTIAYVETEDSLVSVEAGRPGVLVKVLVEPGDAVDPGTAIGVLADREERLDDLDALLASLGVGGQTTPEPPAAPAPREETATPEPAAAPASREEAPHAYLRTTVRVDGLTAVCSQLARNGADDASVAAVVRRAAEAAQRQLPLAATSQDDGSGLVVTDPGRYGVEEAGAVVVAPHVAALAVGAVRSAAVVEGGAVRPAEVLTLTLSLDHRAVAQDGAARWLALLVALLERPEWMLD